MMYYVIILVAMALVVLFNMLFNTFALSLGYIVLATVVMTVAVIAIGGLFAYIIRHILPTKWFDINSRFSNVGKKEIKYYERIGIKKWKDKVLELGMFSGFDKDHVGKSLDSNYFARFIMECNCGAVIHVVDIFVGALIVFIYPLEYWYMFALPVFVVNAFLHYLPVCILRYNVPRLMQGYKLYYAREQRKAKKIEQQTAEQSAEQTEH